MLNSTARGVNISILGHTGITLAEYGINNGKIKEENKDLISSAVHGTNVLHSEYGEGKGDVLQSIYRLINSTRLIVRYDGLLELTKDNPLNLEEMLKIYAYVQVDGGELTDSERSEYKRLGESFIRETAKRFMTKELISIKQANTTTCIDIFNESINKLKSDSKIKIFPEANNYLEKIIDKELDYILNNNTNILEIFLKKVPLTGLNSLSEPIDSFTQNDYEAMINECKSFVKSELKFFDETVNDLIHANELKLSGKNSFSTLIKDYDDFNGRRNLIEAKKEILRDSLNDINSKFLEFGYHDLNDIFPTKDSADDFIKKVKDELYSTSNKKGYLITDGESVLLNDLRSRVSSVAIKKNENPEMFKLKQSMIKSIQLIDDIARYDEELEIHSIRGYLYSLCQEQIGEEKNTDADLGNLINDELDFSDSLNRKLNGIARVEKELNKQDEKEKIKKISDYDDFRAGYFQKVNSLDSNLEQIVLSVLYERVFNDYRNFQYLLSYKDDVKQMVYGKLSNALNNFVDNIQSFSFPAVLNDTLRNIKTDNLTKNLTINLLQTYLSNFLYERFKEEPFIKLEDEMGQAKNPIIAFDSYSLSFCSEIIKRAGLHEDIHNAVEDSILPQLYKEQFIQLLDNTGLTKIGVASELQDSKDLFKSWKGNLESRISDLNLRETKTKSKAKYVITIDSVIDKAESYFNYEIKGQSTTNKRARDEDKRLERKRILFDKVFYQKTKKDAIEKYSNRRQIILAVNSLESLIDKLNEIRLANKKIANDNAKLKAGNKKELLIEPFNDEEIYSLINDFKTVLADTYRNDIKTVDKVSQDINSLLKAKDVKDVTQLFDELSFIIKDAVKIVDNKSKLASINSSLKMIPTQSRLEEALNDLEQLDNDFLKLPDYAHIKGMIKTVINPGSIIKEAKIEEKNMSEDLLMQALVNTYADLQEEYYGRFKTSQAFKESKLFNKPRLNKQNIEIMPGKYLEEQYSIASEELKLLNGINLLKILFESAGSINKGLINPQFLLNYLADYADKENISSFNDLLISFNSRHYFENFFKFLRSRWADINSTLNNQLTNYFNDIKSFLEGGSEKPDKPYELGIINSPEVDVLDRILINVYDNASILEKHPYLTGNVEEPDSPAVKFNLSKVSLKKIEQVKDRLFSYEKQYNKLINKLNSKLKKFEPKTASRDEILTDISSSMQSIILEHLDDYGLDEIELININKIRIRSSLDPLRLVIPEETESRLPVEKRQRDYYQKLINASIGISRNLKQSTSDAVYNTPVFEDLLSTPVKKNNRDLYLVTDLKIPEYLSKDKLKKLLDKNAILSGNQVSLKLPFSIDINEGETFGSALRAYVSGKLTHELSPCKNFLQEYSNKVHTKFKKVADELKLTEFIQTKSST